jgi:hypothetical protein
MATPNKTYWSKLSLAACMNLTYKQFIEAAHRLEINVPAGRYKFNQTEAKKIVKTIFPDLSDKEILKSLGFRD